MISPVQPLLAMLVSHTQQELAYGVGQSQLIDAHCERASLNNLRLVWKHARLLVQKYTVWWLSND